MSTILSRLAKLATSPPIIRPLLRSLPRAPCVQQWICSSGASSSGDSSTCSGSDSSSVSGSRPGPSRANTNKPAVVHGNNENPSVSVRVRRARASDTPRVLRFVREHAQSTWPGIAPPPTIIGNLVLGDYISRTLAQGHTLLAEVSEQAERRGRHLAGLALASSQSPWDAALLDRFATCVRCRRSRTLLRLTAYCLREPQLHEKYSVGKILQILIIVPEGPRSSQVSQLLAKHALKRGKDSGYPLLRFDVTDLTMVEMLEKMKLTKEWQFPADKIKELDSKAQVPLEKMIVVYSAQAQQGIA